MNCRQYPADRCKMMRLIVFQARSIQKLSKQWPQSRILAYSAVMIRSIAFQTGGKGRTVRQAMAETTEGVTRGRIGTANGGNLGAVHLPFDRRSIPCADQALTGRTKATGSAAARSSRPPSCWRLSRPAAHPR